MEKKYMLSTETESVWTNMGYVNAHRIIALVDIPEYGVEVGNIGGFVESETNLSHEGSCWVFDDACVSGNACVSGDAIIRDNAMIYGNAKVTDYATVYDTARVSGNGTVGGEAYIHDNAHVCGEAVVDGTAKIHGTATVCANASIHSNSDVFWFNAPIRERWGKTTADTFYRCADGIARVYSMDSDFCMKMHDYAKCACDSWKGGDPAVYDALINFIKCHMKLTDAEIGIVENTNN